MRSKRGILAATVLLVAGGACITTTAAAGPDAVDTKGKPTVVSTSVDRDGATAFNGYNSTPIDVTTKVFSDGTKQSKASSSDLAVVVQEGRMQASVGLTDADIQHWVNFEAGSSTDGPRPGEAGGAPALASRAAAGTLPNPVCLSMDRGDEAIKTIHLRTCTQYSEGRRANGKMFFKAKNTATGSANDTSCSFNCDKLLGFSVSSSYSAGQVVGWAPNSDEQIGACTTRSTSVSASSVSVSESNTVCPDRWGPYDLRNRASGSFWKGNAVRSNVGGLHVQVVQLDVNIAADFMVDATVNWT